MRPDRDKWKFIVLAIVRKHSIKLLVAYEIVWGEK